MVCEIHLELFFRYFSFFFSVRVRLPASKSSDDYYILNLQRTLMQKVFVGVLVYPKLHTTLGAADTLNTATHIR